VKQRALRADGVDVVRAAAPHPVQRALGSGVKLGPSTPVVVQRRPLVADDENVVLGRTPDAVERDARFDLETQFHGRPSSAVVVQERVRVAHGVHVVRPRSPNPDQKRAELEPRGLEAEPFAALERRRAERRTTEVPDVVAEFEAGFTGRRQGVAQLLSVDFAVAARAEAGGSVVAAGIGARHLACIEAEVLAARARVRRTVAVFARCRIDDVVPAALDFAIRPADAVRRLRVRAAQIALLLTFDEPIAAGLVRAAISAAAVARRGRAVIADLIAAHEAVSAHLGGAHAEHAASRTG
jgi:hypothetical protein